MYGGSLKNRRQKTHHSCASIMVVARAGLQRRERRDLNILKSVYEATGGAEHLKHLSKRMDEIPEAAFCAELDGAQTAVRTKAVSRKTK